MNGKRKFGIVAFPGLGDDTHFVASASKLARQDLAHFLDTTHAGMKKMGGEQDFHFAAGARK
jgi:hypothetical protein